MQHSDELEEQGVVAVVHHDSAVQEEEGQEERLVQTVREVQEVQERAEVKALLPEAQVEELLDAVVVLVEVEADEAPVKVV